MVQGNETAKYKASKQIAQTNQEKYKYKHPQISKTNKKSVHI